MFLQHIKVDTRQERIILKNCWGRASLVSFFCKNCPEFENWMDDYRRESGWSIILKPFKKAEQAIHAGDTSEAAVAQASWQLFI